MGARLQHHPLAFLADCVAIRWDLYFFKDVDQTQPCDDGDLYSLRPVFLDRLYGQDEMIICYSRFMI